MAKKEEPLNLNHADPSEVKKALYVLLVCVNENFKNQLLSFE